MKIKKYFRLAKAVATKGDGKRQHRLGAIGIRNDGVLVGANNLCARNICPEAHAEYRVCKMLTPDSVVFVVRVSRSNQLVMAKPCKNCRGIMKAKGVKKCYYSTPDGYGVIEF